MSRLNSLILLVAFLWLSTAHAARPEENPEAKYTMIKYCLEAFEKRKKPNEELEFTNVFQKRIQSDEGKMGFCNQGGRKMLGHPEGIGTCWWHSRFHRNATYLAIFLPSLEKDPKAVKAIVNELRDGDRVVLIPGYKNLLEFSTENEKVIQKMMDDWQSSETGRGAILEGLAGKAGMSEKALEKEMDDLYSEVSKKKISYLKMQLSGLNCHSWLVVGMTKVSKGYDLEIQDSNFKESYQYQYRYGQSSFDAKLMGLGKTTPFLERVSELKTMKAGMAKFCAKVLEKYDDYAQYVQEIEEKQLGELGKLLLPKRLVIEQKEAAEEMQWFELEGLDNIKKIAVARGKVKAIDMKKAKETLLSLDVPVASVMFEVDLEKTSKDALPELKLLKNSVSINSVEINRLEPRVTLGTLVKGVPVSLAAHIYKQVGWDPRQAEAKSYKISLRLTDVAFFKKDRCQLEGFTNRDQPVWACPAP